MEEIAKKKMIPKAHPNGTALFIVWMEGGGRVPNQLSGAYGSASKAQRAIDQYHRVAAVQKANTRSYRRKKQDGSENQVRD